jgi:molecular chaperone DnaK
VHPDEVVAIGAAIAAEAIAGGHVSLLHDVTAHSLGIMTAGGRFDPLIVANTPVPTSTTTVFGTSRDGQRTVKIVVLQGESPRAEENHVLGRFTLSGLREAPAGQVEIEVTFRIDDDGIVSVSARDLETGAESSIDVMGSSGLSEDEIQRMMEDSAAHLATRRAQEAAESRRQSCRVLIDELTRVFPDAARRLEWTPRGTDALQKAEQAVSAVERGLHEADLETLDKHLALLERVQSMLTKVLAAEGR